MNEANTIDLSIPSGETGEITAPRSYDEASHTSFSGLLWSQWHSALQFRYFAVL